MTTLRRKQKKKSPLNASIDVETVTVDDSVEAAQLAPALTSPAPSHIPACSIQYYDFNTPAPVNGASPTPNGAFCGAAGSPYRITSLLDPPVDRDDHQPGLPLEGPGILPPRGVIDDQRSAPFLYRAGDEQLNSREVIIDKNGQPRQAGATMPEGEFIKRFKLRAEQSLFIFLKGVLGRFFLTSHFHRDACAWLQKCPPYRKLKLMPREHAKTTIVAGGLPPHILIQPAATNIYFPGLEGSECRILLAGETETMAKKNLRVVESVFEENKLFRAFWPHRVWEGRSKSASRMWSDSGMIIPRANEWPDPTIRAVGVGGAITGARPNVMVKDDLVSFKAANSAVVMDEAIEWHKASRALLDKYEIESGLQSLEFLIGTRWAVYDLYSYIIDKDPSVEVNDTRFHRIINDGAILWPEKYTLVDIEQLQLEHGSNFYLLYLNSAADPELTDFDIDLIRDFSIIGDSIVFDEDERDVILAKRFDMKAKRATGEVPPARVERGSTLNAAMMQRMIDGGGTFRLRGV